MTLHTSNAISELDSTFTGTAEISFIFYFLLSNKKHGQVPKALCSVVRTKDTGKSQNSLLGEK